MSRADWTPGPWGFHALLSGSENHKGYAITSGRARLATAIPYDSDGDTGGANARLMAASPDMHDALAAIIQTVSTDVTEKSQAVRAALALGQAALAKARDE